MCKTTSTLKRFTKNRSGNVAIMAGITAPLMMGVLALGVDYGSLTLQKRQLQQTADLAAVSAASATDVDRAVLQYFKLNNKNLGVKTASGILTETGTIPFDPETAFSGRDGYAEVIKGRYIADPNVSIGNRFVENATPTNAVKVNIVEQGRIFFAGTFTTAPKISAVGTAAGEKIAAFSVGSRLASLNGGLLNNLLGGLLGTTVALNVSDYQALVATDINALKLIDSLATDLSLTAGTYRDVLQTEISYGKFLAALTKATGTKPTVTTALKTLEKAAAKTTIKLRLEEILALGPILDKQIGAAENLSVNAGVFELINAAATIANAGKQVSVDAGLSVPGLAATRLTIAIGEPPVGTPSLAIGTPGTVVRTAQTRLMIDTKIDGLKALLGLSVRVPLYVEVANAEAKLSEIRCSTGGAGTVDVAVVPGIAEISLGNVDMSGFNNFGRDPRVTKAAIVDSLLLRINAMAHIDSANGRPTTLTFQPADIAQGTIKNVSTRDITTSLVKSLLKELDVDISLLIITIGSQPVIQAALAETLSVATAPIDSLLYNTLMLLGVKVGEADVRVTDARCSHPALVQ
ncbi:putative membrane protein [Rhizobium skierniewicense]|uniref:Putative membrane protein n=1 Tax=Rhizobium skierniewicense TaxID=984260 RepID=A0A7W6C900_9HYPH|nr:pilus assembly protein TadG-related protein [Rhizobium skierniewicense]MBB3947907.1 putative membrane protein [Rhizobium skierniewicense]